MLLTREESNHDNAGGKKMRPVDIIFPEMKKLKDEGKCPICKEIIGEFKDELSKKEFRISGLCQKCQDETFG